MQVIKCTKCGQEHTFTAHNWFWKECIRCGVDLNTITVFTAGGGRLTVRYTAKAVRFFKRNDAVEHIYVNGKFI